MHFEAGEMEVKVNDALNEKFEFEQCDLPKMSAILLKMESKDVIFQLCVTSAWKMHFLTSQKIQKISKNFSFCGSGLFPSMFKLCFQLPQPQTCEDNIIFVSY